MPPYHTIALLFNLNLHGQNGKWVKFKKKRELNYEKTSIFMGSSNKKVHVYVNDRVNHIIQDVWDGPTLTDLLL